MRSIQPTRNHNRGFTLTDLLVIVAGMCLAGAILLAQLVAAKARTGLTTCTGNLAKVNQAVLQFAADNRERLPAPPVDDKRNLWWWYKEQVKSYAGLRGESSASDTVFACPNDRGYSDPVPFYK